MAIEAQELGPLLKRSRRQAGLTQEELAEAAGVSARSVSEIERGVQQHPHVSTLRRLADGLGLQAERRTAFLLAGDCDGRATHSRDSMPASPDVDPVRSPAVPILLIAGLRGYTNALLQRLARSSGQARGRRWRWK